MSSAAVSNGGGLVFNSPGFRAFNRTGATVLKGELVQCDVTLSSTEATGFTAVTSGLDPEADGFSNVVVATDVNGGISAIALEDVEDNKPGRFQLEGIVRQALVQWDSGGSSGGDIEQGTILGSVAAEKYLTEGTANSTKALALSLDFITDETAVTEIPVYFNGVSGIGTP